MDWHERWIVEQSMIENRRFWDSSALWMDGVVGSKFSTEKVKTKVRLLKATEFRTMIQQGV